MEVYRGDIFYVTENKAVQGCEQLQDRPAVVVSNNKGNKHSSIVEVVFLTTKEKSKYLPTHTKVLCQIPSTALCEQVTSISILRLGEYIRTCTEAEMKAIDRCLMISLGLTESTNGQAAEDSEKINDLEMMLKCSEKASEERRVMLESVQKQIADANEYIEKQTCLIKQLESEKSAKNNYPAEVVALKAQIEVYKEQNDRMFKALMGA